MSKMDDLRKVNNQLRSLIVDLEAEACRCDVLYGYTCSIHKFIRDRLTGLNLKETISTTLMERIARTVAKDECPMREPDPADGVTRVEPFDHSIMSS